jgi:hypothetical protein
MALFEITKEFKDGTKSIEIVANQVKIYPKQDSIRFANSKRFKYDIKTKYMVGIVSTVNGKYIVGGEGPWVPCHPETQLSDINVIKETTKVIKQPKEKEQTYQFSSKSSDSIYTVRIFMGKYRCDCPGMMRVKDKTLGCKHIQEVRKKNENK